MGLSTEHIEALDLKEDEHDWRSTLIFDGKEPAFPPKLFFRLIDYSFEKINELNDEKNSLNFILNHISEEVKQSIEEDVSKRESVEASLVKKYGHSKITLLAKQFLLLRSLKKSSGEDPQQFLIRVRYCMNFIGADKFDVCDWETIFFLLGLGTKELAELDWNESTIKDAIKSVLKKDVSAEGKTSTGLTKTDSNDDKSLKSTGGSKLEAVKREPLDEDSIYHSLTKFNKDDTKYDSHNSDSENFKTTKNRRKRKQRNKLSIQITSEWEDLSETYEEEIAKPVKKKAKKKRSEKVQDSLGDVDPSTPAVKLEDLDFNERLMFPKMASDQNCPVYVCAVCSEILRSRDEFNEHIEFAHGGKAFKCDTCNYICKTRLLLAKHRYRVHEILTKGYETVYHCEEEGCAFRSVILSSVNEHFKSCHSKEGKKKAISDSGSQHTCSTCGKTFDKKIRLMSHMKNVHQEATENFVCELCGKSFSSHQNYQSHVKIIHKNIRKHVCDVCGKAYGHSYQLSYHKVRKHNDGTKPSPYEVVCDTCGEKFPFRYSLLHHINRVHKEPEFECPKCGLKYRDHNTIKRHIRSHLKLLPFTCTECSSAFSAIENLTTHISVKHMGITAKEARKKENIKKARNHPAFKMDGQIYHASLDYLIELLTTENSSDRL